MSVSLQDVKRVLDPDEPNYGTGRALGPDALPHLATLAQGPDEHLAAKAVYLASLIGTDAGVAVVREALGNASPLVRIQAAAGARHLGSAAAATLLPPLLGDADTGVGKCALRSAQAVVSPASMPEAVRARVAALSQSDPVPFIRTLASSISSAPPR
jgi:HEAT repeat protein